MKALQISMVCMLAATMMACDGGTNNPGTGGGDNAGGGDNSGGSGNAMNQGGAGGGEECPTQANGVAANHIVIHVSWPSTLGLEAGEGDMHVWTKASLTFNGNDVTGTAEPCGSVIPALTKSSVAGGGQVQTQIPDEVWEAMGMPEFSVAGSISGFNVGATISMDPIASTVGCMLADPANDPWPASGAQVMSMDHDGDGQPGIKAIPRTDAPFAAPPLSLQDALNENGKRADEVYIASRTIIQLAGTRDSCTSAKGTATVTAVDSHVVGCHVKDGGVCTTDQAKFVDDNQPKFTIESATYEMKQVPEGATCADVRAALPM